MNAKKLTFNHSKQIPLKTTTQNNELFFLDEHFKHWQHQTHRRTQGPETNNLFYVAEILQTFIRSSTM